MKKGIEYLSSNTKRELDITGGLAFAVATLPLAATVGLAAAIDNRSSNPFFLQERTGKDNTTFNILKFRTIAKRAMSNNCYGAFDPRASSTGQTLRQAGLDEIPQLYNVIRGTMSLVGPRPMTEEDIDYMEFAAPKTFDEWHANYLASRPGIAGASQIYRHGFRMSRTPEIYRKSAELDLRYFDTASLIVDLNILARAPFETIQVNRNVVENLQPA
jgi:lipopolysaccharide/colanic/teichoic acid biosynthesis glycosyltransferase